MPLFHVSKLMRHLLVVGMVSAPLATLAQDAEFDLQHGLKIIKADEAYAQGFTGKGVVVAVVDSGIDSSHPEFFGKLLAGFDFNTNQVILPQSGNTDLPTVDEDGEVNVLGHGTHVSGIIAANKDGQGMHGVAYDSQLFMIKLADDFEEAFVRVANQGAKIVNLSLGINECYGLDSDTDFCNVTEYAYEDLARLEDEPGLLRGLQALHKNDVLVVAATGNEQQPHPDVLGGMPYLVPELESTSLVVTSVNRFNELASYSNQCGVAADWCLSAPGGDDTDRDNMPIVSSVPGGGYAGDTMMGTSMAAPHVTGVAALVAEAFPYFSANNLQQTLLTTATPLGDRSLYGWGLVNAGKAVNGPAQFIHVFQADTKGMDSVFSNDISGEGALLKTGLGRLELSGQNTFSTASLEMGELAITGTHANAIVTQKDTQLTGDGKIGQAVVAGVIAPGVKEKNPFGHLTIEDTFVAEQGAVLDIVTSIDGDSSQLRVNGASFLDGMDIVLSGNAFRPGVSYTVLQGNNPVAGQVGHLTGGSTAFLESRLEQGLNQVQARIVRNNLSLASFAQTANQIAVAQGLDEHSAGAVVGLQPLYDSLLNSDGSSLPQLGQQLSAEVYSTAKAALVQSDRRWAQQLLRQSRTLQSADSLPVWVDISSSRQQLGAKNGASKAKFNQTGVALGAQWDVSSLWALGAALAYQDGKLNVRERDEQAKSKSYSAALYAKTQFPLISGSGAINWLSGMSFTHHRVDYKRTFSALENQRLASKANTNNYQLFTELGLPIALNEQWNIEPFLGAGWLHSRAGAVAEEGGYTALSQNSTTLNTGYAQLGLRNAYEWGLANGQVGSAYVDLAWQHGFGKEQPRSRLHFSANEHVGFTTHGASLSKNSLQLGVGAALALTASSHVSLLYQGAFAGSGSHQHGGMLSLQHRF